jgi:hypothetical protein
MNDLDKITNLIDKILDIQENAGRNYWPKGMFPNFRSNKFIGYSRPDNSVFYTASIVFILKNIQKDTSAEIQKKIENIIRNAKPNFIAYQSITGENIYNFYPTKPSQHFGNGFIFRHFKHFQLPHDADDTSLIYLSSEFQKNDNIWLQKKLSKHANGTVKTIKNTKNKFKHLLAYSTWFGKNMAIEFDAVVLCNILYSQLAANLDFDKHGLASWAYIKECVLSGDYLKAPFEIAHNYGKTSVIAYHITKLITDFDLPESGLVRSKLKTDLKSLFDKNESSTMYKLLISSSLYRLGVDHFFEVKWPISHTITENFSFFFAGLLSSYEFKILQFLAKYPIFHIYWTCPAHTLALITENLVLKNKKA